MTNSEEQLGLDSLRMQGYTNLELEPDGNIPPDIVINKKIAIEVRRLNQKDKLGQGLETDYFRLHSIMENVLRSESTSRTSR